MCIYVWVMIKPNFRKTAMIGDRCPTKELMKWIGTGLIPKSYELFETITLIQTEKIQKIPIILYGSEYWNGLLDWMKNIVLEKT